MGIADFYLKLILENMIMVNSRQYINHLLMKVYFEF